MSLQTKGRMIHHAMHFDPDKLEVLINADASVGPSDSMPATPLVAVVQVDGHPKSTKLLVEVNF